MLTEWRWQLTVEKVEREEELKERAISFLTQNKPFWTAAVTYMIQDTTGQKVGRDKFLKLPFKLHTPKCSFPLHVVLRG